MPVEFKPEPEDPDDEEYMEQAQEVKTGPSLRLRVKQKVDPMEELEKRYVAMLRTWLAAKPKRSAPEADVYVFCEVLRDSHVSRSSTHCMRRRIS